jgi:hypothetical protein
MKAFNFKKFADVHTDDGELPNSAFSAVGNRIATCGKLSM